ncbi:ComF family protein [Reinekea marinisedimentorum]|uniref:ComF family protein n=1 Tax=Reinekea marinisedimentorum TaxID=230495 RepID=A0A4R3I0P4_9GAMM|nr:ComF family protein [Reinekea marinisedimentorum]TCS38145.1 ComF family protein [Reinekea marinisedimentorum]
MQVGYHSLLSWLPLLCPGCTQPSRHGLLCPVCRSYLSSINEPCPLCGEPDCNGEICGNCQKRPPLWQSARLPWHFSGLTRFLIHDFKYNHNLAAGRALAAEWLADFSPAVKPEAIVAVPMHHRRKHYKGFNQAEWLAGRMSKHLQIPRWNGLVRQQQTVTLEGLTKKERQKALTNAFAVREAPPQHIALVDDVYTSGATATEVSRTLKKAGCQKIDIWALARTPLQ